MSRIKNCSYLIEYEYIDHYRNLPTDLYGPFVLDEFDIEIIQMFN